MYLKRILAAVLVLGFLPITQARAESLLFSIRNDYPYTLMLVFYSDDRNWEWPGDDQAYVLDDNRIHDYPLNCNYGEKICYGAWPKGSRKYYWGVGQDRSHYCTDCCYICNGGETGVIVLND